jgi:hypothetical protein
MNSTVGLISASLAAITSICMLQSWEKSMKTTHPIIGADLQGFS